LFDRAAEASCWNPRADVQRGVEIVGFEEVRITFVRRLAFAGGGRQPLEAGLGNHFGRGRSAVSATKTGEAAPVSTGCAMVAA
jgi:hypothetical protein